MSLHPSPELLWPLCVAFGAAAAVAWLLPLALVLIALTGLGFTRGVSANRLGYALAGVSLIAIGAAWLLLTRGTFVPVLGALAWGWTAYLALSALAYLDERRVRLRTSGMFKRFLDPRVVSDLIERGDLDYRREARSTEVTVLFSDIRGFTALSELASAEEVVAMLNGYFSRQTEVVFAHGGTLDKFIGDAIMAFWGAPVAQPDSARLAVEAALAMSAALEELRGEIGALGADLEIGIGLHTGRAVVGFIGSADRLDYTVIGDTVNLASRVEGLTKGVARVLVTEATRERVSTAFGVPVIDTYACGECIFLSTGCTTNRGAHVNADWAILEVVDEHNRPVPDGTLGHRVLLTNLANRVQPLIRYEIGDRIAMATEPCSCGSRLPRIDRIDDRVGDVFWVGKAPHFKALSAYPFQHAFEFLRDIREWQATQVERNRVVVRIEMLPGAVLDTAKARERLRERLTLNGFGDDLSVEFLEVEKLQIDASTGKFRRLVNLVGPPESI